MNKMQNDAIECGGLDLPIQQIIMALPAGCHDSDGTFSPPFEAISGHVSYKPLRRPTRTRPAGREGEAIKADTDAPMTASQLAEALRRKASPVEKESAPLGCTPDDYPLY